MLSNSFTSPRQPLHHHRHHQCLHDHHHHPSTLSHASIHTHTIFSHPFHSLHSNLYRQHRHFNQVYRHRQQQRSFSNISIAHVAQYQEHGAPETVLKCDDRYLMIVD